LQARLKGKEECRGDGKDGRMVEGEMRKEKKSKRLQRVLAPFIGRTAQHSDLTPIKCLFPSLWTVSSGLCGANSWCPPVLTISKVIRVAGYVDFKFNVRERATSTHSLALSSRS